MFLVLCAKMTGDLTWNLPFAHRGVEDASASRVRADARTQAHECTCACRFPARVGDAVARDTTVTFGAGTVGRRGRGGEIQKGNKRGGYTPRVYAHSRTHRRTYVGERGMRISGRGTKQPTRQLLSYKEREDERRGVQVGRTEIRIKNASRSALAEGV